MIVIFDIVILLLLGLAAWRGWRNGFIMEIFYTLFIFVSIYLSIHLSNWVAEKWGGPPPNAAGLKTFLIILGILSVALFFLAKLASIAIKAGHCLDREHPRTSLVVNHASFLKKPRQHPR